MSDNSTTYRAVRRFLAIAKRFVGLVLLALEVVDKLGKELVSYGKTKSQSGYGLGLSHADEFIERSDGRIEVESKLGIGTQLKIFLPS